MNIAASCGVSATDGQEHADVEAAATDMAAAAGFFCVCV